MNRIRHPAARRAATSFPAILALAALAACSKAPPPAPAPRPVFVSIVPSEDAGLARQFTGTVRARVEAEVGFRAGGKVIERLVDVGQSVRAGQPLARLDPADYQLAVQAAADQVQAAQVDAEQSASDEARFKRLSAEGSVGSADHERQKARADAAAARLSQARQQWQLARNREAYTTLVAPFDGIVTQLRFERGQVVAEGQPVLAVARQGEREVVADIPEAWVAALRRSSAELRASAGASVTPLALQLRELSPLATSAGRTFRARFAPTPAARRAVDELPLGSTADLRLALPGAQDASVSVPATALVKASGEPGVWALNAAGNGLVFQPVRVQTLDDTTLRVSGLTPGQRIVTVGAQKLDASVAVRPVTRPADAVATTTPRSAS
jgi:RND family efflux transporter MFP subunit